MKRLVVLLVLSLSTLTATWAQEVCNNGRDDDGDGFIDCYDKDCSVSTFCKDFFLGEEAKCEVTPPAFPQFTMALDFSSPNETTNHLSRMAIGDLNRDGKPEIITMNRYTNRLFILNGSDGTIQQQATVNFEPQWEVAIANIDNDNCGEIFFYGYEDPAGSNNAGNYIYAYDCNLNFIWRTVERLPGEPVNYGLADFDGDGRVELYVKDEVYDAHTGTRIIKSIASDYKQINGGPVAVDMMGDDDLELVNGCSIFSVNLGARTLDAGSLTLLKSRNDYFIRNEFNATSVADFNQDGFLDVLASGSTNSHGDNTTVFFWDVQNDVLKTYSDPIPGNFTIFACPTVTGDYYKDGWKNGTGRINIADLDGDGRLNVSYVSGKFLYALDENLSPMSWSPKVVNEETSGYTGCTLFDFNGDGKSEIVYRDERFLYIINGTNGTIYNQQGCVSRTNREYPIVADVDADGSTELCVTCGFNDTDAVNNFCDINYSRYSHVRVFRSGSDPWVPARRVWNQHGYFNVNVNDNLTIPIKQQKHHLVFSTGSCTVGPNRPLNSFLNQTPFLNIDGCPTYKSPDLAFVNNSLVVNPPTCPSQSFTISFQLQNKGDIALSGNVPITFYNGNPSVAGAIKLNTITAPLLNLGVNGTFSVTNATVNGPGGPFTLYIVLNDDGSTVPTPISLPNTDFLECDYNNNIISSPINPLPVSITAIKVKDNLKCTGSTTPNNGAVRAFVPGPAGTENTTDYNFYWSIGNVAKPVPADFQGAAINGLQDATYTVFAIHKTANCSSSAATVVVPRSSQTILATVLLQSPFTNCKNPNGSLKVVVNDTDGNGVGDPVSNYTYTWYEGVDIFTDPQVSISDIPTGLRPLTYTVVVTEKTTGCQSISSFTVPDQSTKPVVSATNTNITCSATNSGTASATVGGVTAGFKFLWYNGAAVKPSANFTGANYINLAAGKYTVVAENNTTKCESDPVTVTITQSTPIVVAVTGVAHQTSCDPTKPNGSASANVGGTTTGFTFEWFKGQNTLLANRVSTSATATGLVKATYTVKATNTATGCTDTEVVTINTAVVTPSLILAGVNGLTNCTTPNGSVTVNVSLDAPSDYTFKWYNGSSVKATPDFADTDNQLDGLAIGTYTVEAVHKTKFCSTGPVSANVVDNTPTILISLNSSITVLPSDCSSANGVMAVSVTAPGNTLGFNIQWFFGRAPFAAPSIRTDNGVTTSTATNLRTGVYTVMATNVNNGCQAFAEFDLPFANAHGLNFISKVDVDKCIPINTGSITVDLDPTPLAGFDEDDYDIELYSGTNDTGTAIQTIPGVLAVQQYTTNNNLTPGFYTLVAISKNPLTLSCRSVPLVVEIKQNAVFPSIVALQNNANSNCAGALANGSIVLDIDGPAPQSNYSYAWFEGQSISAPVLGTNTSGNTTGSGETAQNLPGGFFAVNVTDNVTQCSSSTAYQVFNNPVVISVSAADITLTDITMCNNPTAGAAVINTVREDGTPAALGNYTFSWVDVNQNILPNAGAPNTTNAINNLTPGDYFVTLTKNGGTTGLNCASPQIAFAIIDQTIGTVQVSLLSFTKPTRCLQPTNVLGELVADASGSSTTGYGYNWYAGNTVSGAPVSTSANHSNIAIPLGQPDITFTVEATNNSNLCTARETFVLPLDIAPVLLTASAAPLTFCASNDGSIFATVTSGNSNGYTYRWDIGNTFQAPADFTGKQINNLPSGTYTVLAEDQADTFCQSVPTNVTINDERVFPVPSATMVAPLTICDPSRPDGVARVSVNNDVVSYRFDWFNGVPPIGAAIYSGSEFGNLPAATFSVTATNLVTGCSGTTQVTINQNIVAVPVPQVVLISNVTSCRTDNGALSASVNGNTGDFIFHWYNTNPGVPADTASASFIGEIYTNLSVGIYFVSATSRLTGCISAPADAPIIEAPIIPDFDFIVDSPTCSIFNSEGGTADANGDPTGSLTLNLLNSFEIESITWRTGGTIVGTGPLLANIEAGSYEVEVISTSGCARTKTVDVVPDINPFNGISRNGDDKNPIFHINCIENFPQNLVKIFNRAGTLVFEAEGYDNVETYFDGKSNKGIAVMGNNLPDGTYFYIIDKRDGSKQIAGYIEVVN